MDRSPHFTPNVNIRYPEFDPVHSTVGPPLMNQDNRSLQNLSREPFSTPSHHNEPPVFFRKCQSHPRLFPDIHKASSDDNLQRPPEHDLQLRPKKEKYPSPYDKIQLTIDIPQEDPFHPQLNRYQQRKSIGEGLMDLALFSSNANQLRYLVEYFDSDRLHHYASIALISISLIMQVVVAMGLILNSRYDVMEAEGIAKAEKINNWTVVGIFLITVLNVFIVSFGINSAE